MPPARAARSAGTARARELRGLSTGLPRRRRWIGASLAAVGPPVLTWALVTAHPGLRLGSVLLLNLLVVVVVAVVGGSAAAVLGALVSFLLVNWFFVPPYHTFVIASRDNLVDLTVFVLVAVTVSVVAELGARGRAVASRRELEAALLSRLAAEPVGSSTVEDVLEEVKESFGMTSVALVEQGRDGPRTVALTGPPLSGTPSISAEAGDGLRLLAEGPELFAEDRRLLDDLAAAAARALEGRRLATEAEQARQLAEVDRMRSALLAAVGHDLRTPLAGIKAAASGLRQEDVDWTTEERAELLATIEESADRLDDLVSNLLAMSRLQAGALSARLEPTALDEVVARAVLGLPHGAVRVDVPDDLPLVAADGGLLERVVANLLANAVRYSPAGFQVQVTGRLGADAVALSVVDHGPGVPQESLERMFVPFQRLGDRSPGGVGLGLAIARGFTDAMGAALLPSRTQGGGLTMTMRLPLSAAGP